MVGTASSANGLVRLGFSSGQVVLEVGYDDDVDEAVRAAIEEITGEPIEDESYGDVVDGVLLWWRDGDGDLTDSLINTVGLLDDQGFVVVATPKVGRSEAVDAAEVGEAADTAGLHASASVTLCEDWVATRLVAPKGVRR